MTDEELCGALTARLQAAIYRQGYSGYREDREHIPIAIYKRGEADANSFMVLFKIGQGDDSHDVCIWASDWHLHVFANGVCILFAGDDGLSPNARELWNAVRGIQTGGAMPDAVRARQQLCEALSGGAT